jgi:hypothetical protein
VGPPVKPGKTRDLCGLETPLKRSGCIATDLCDCPQQETPQVKDDSMENSGTREMPSPTADIKTLNLELQQLFAGTQNSNREPREKTGDTSEGACLVIKGK